MKNRRTHASARKQNPKADARRQALLRFLRQNTWLVLLLVLILVAIVLFICVITGAPERAEEAAAPSGSRYQTA